MLGLRELGQCPNAHGEGTDNSDDGNGSGFRSGDHGGMTGDSGEDSGSGQEDLFGPFVRAYPPAVAATVSSTKHAATTPEDPQEATLT